MMDTVSFNAPVLTFGLVLTRLGGFMVALPLFAGEVAPLRVRIAIDLVLALVLGLAGPGVQMESFSTSRLVVAGLTEFLLGIFLGLVVRLTIAAAELSGELLGMQMGFGFSRLVDPMLDEQVGPLTRVITLVTGALFFITDGYRDVVRALAASLTAIPPGSAAVNGRWAAFLMERASAMFAGGIRIAAPIVIAVFGAQLSFGFLSRVAPQLNLWAIGFLVTIGVGLICTALFAPSLVAEVRDLLQDGVGELGAAVSR